MYRSISLYMVSLSINARYINVYVYFFSNLNYSMNNTRNCSFKLAIRYPMVCTDVCCLQYIFTSY